VLSNFLKEHGKHSDLLILHLSLDIFNFSGQCFVQYFDCPKNYFGPFCHDRRVQNTFKVDYIGCVTTDINSSKWNIDVFPRGELVEC